MGCWHGRGGTAGCQSTSIPHTGQHSGPGWSTTATGHAHATTAATGVCARLYQCNATSTHIIWSTSPFFSPPRALSAPPSRHTTLHHHTATTQDDWWDAVDNTDSPFVPSLTHLEAVLGAVPTLEPLSEAADNQQRGRGPLGGRKQGTYRHPLERRLQELCYTDAQLNAPSGTLPQPPVRVVPQRMFIEQPQWLLDWNAVN